MVVLFHSCLALTVGASCGIVTAPAAVVVVVVVVVVFVVVNVDVDVDVAAALAFVPLGFPTVAVDCV